MHVFRTLIFCDLFRFYGYFLSFKLAFDSSLLTIWNNKAVEFTIYGIKTKYQKVKTAKT